MSVTQWSIGQEVDVTSRTWPGINKPGGHGKIVKIHYSSLGVVDSLDVRYTLGNNTDTNLETDLVKAHIELDRGRRSRRSRDFLKVGDDPAASQGKKKPKATTKAISDDDDDDDDEVYVEDDKENQTDPPKTTTKVTKKAIPAKKRKKPCPEGPRPALSKKRKNKLLKATTANIAAPKNTKKDKTAGNSEEAVEETSDIPKYIVTRGAESLGPISPLVAGTTEKDNKRDSSITQNRRSISDEEETCIKSKAANSVEPAAQDAEEYGGRKTLKNVYDGQIQEASKYVNSLVGGPQPEAMPKKPKPFSPPPVKTAEQVAEEERCQEFGKHFTNVMLQHDMAIPEDELLEEINGSGCKPFTATEVDRFVTRLCDQEKVMKSDGFFYSI